MPLLLRSRQQHRARQQVLVTHRGCAEKEIFPVPTRKYPLPNLTVNGRAHAREYMGANRVSGAESKVRFRKWFIRSHAIVEGVRSHLVQLANTLQFVWRSKSG